MSEWRISQLNENRCESALRFLRHHFYPYEPCAKALNLCPIGYIIPSLENQIRMIIKKNLSLVAMVPGKDDIVGLLIIDEKRKGSDEPNEEGDLIAQGYPETFVKLDKFFGDLCTKFGSQNIFDSMNTKRILDIFMLCTSSTVAKRGVGTALVSEALAVASKNGIDTVQCMALSLYTQKMCQKYNFEEFNRIKYQDYKQNGEVLFGNANMGEHKYGVIYVMKLL